MVSHHMIATGEGARLATEARGTPDKGTILLVMGATASMVWWPDSLLDTLASAGYQVIRFDLRDTGQSTIYTPGEPGYDLADLASDILAILDAYEIKAAHLVGMSLGAYIAQIVALRHPERVLSLSLLAAEPLGHTYEGEGISDEFMAHFGGMATLDWTVRAAVAAFLLGIARLSAGSAAPFDAAAAQQRIAAELDHAQNMQSAFNHAAVTGGVDGLDLADITVPVLAIHGSEDPVIALAAGQKIAATAPNSRLLVLPGTGHELVARDVPTITKAILDLVGR